MSSNDICMLITIMVYLIGMVTIGILCSKKTNNVGDFYLGGRKLGPIVTAMSAEASDMSSWLLMGLPGVALLCGTAEASWTAIGLAVGTYINWLIVAKRLRTYTHHCKAITIPDFFSSRYHDNRHMLMGIAAVIILIFFVPYTASGFAACGKLFNSLFNIDYHLAMILSAVALGRNDKVAFIGESEQAITMLFKILMEEEQPDSGTFKWGVSTSTSYFPVDHSAYFNDCDLSILDWIRQYSENDITDTFLRGFLGRMLFSGDDVYKPVKVLSGGEKVRCMFSRMMLYHSNVLLLDRPTNHLDLESITAVNNGLVSFKGVVLLSSHDHEILQTVANRIIEITPEGCLDRQGTYEEFLQWKKEQGK